jgi:hypothetical protein
VTRRERQLLRLLQHVVEQCAGTTILKPDQCAACNMAVEAVRELDEEKT